jgi:hypothetical protein
MLSNKNQYICLVDGSSTPALPAVFEGIPPTRVVQLGRNRWSWIWNKANGAVIRPRKVEPPGKIPTVVNPTSGNRVEVKPLVRAGLITLAFITLLGAIFLIGSQVKKEKI